MSLVATRWAWDADVGGTDKLVLMALADHADDDGLCWPSIERIAKRCGVSDRSVQRAIAALLERKLVTRSGENGTLPRYRLAIQVAADPRQDVTPSPDNLSPLPRQDVTPPPTNCHRSPDNLSPEPTSEPIKEAKEGVAPQRVARLEPRGSRLSLEWMPSDIDRAYAVSLGLAPDRIAERFRNHWLAKPGAAGRKVDWPATWRNWCLRDADDVSPAARPAARGFQRQSNEDVLRAAGLMPDNDPAPLLPMLTEARRHH